MLKRLIGEDISIETRFVPRPCTIKVDAGQIDQVLVNLAVNARDAMPKGGKLTLETSVLTPDEGFYIKHPELPRGALACLLIRDTGCGMTTEAKEHLFEPFYTTKEHGKGSGLGLSMVYGFAKQSRGHVKIYSEPGHGTTVRLYLPRAGGEAMPTRAAALDESAPIHIDATILVVEDNPDVRKVVCQLLGDFGCTVIEAPNAAAALTHLESKREIDLLFTDIVMPGGMAGTDLALAARRMRPEIKTLLTSGFAEASIRDQPRFKDIGDILSKPYRRQDLARKLIEILGRK